MRKIGQIGMLFFLIFMFLFQLPSLAQSKKYFVIQGNIVPEAGKSGTGIIEVTKNGKETTKIEVPKNLRFRLELDFFNEYTLNFTYPGHFNKIILISTEIPQEVWARDNDFPNFPMIVNLTPEIDGIDKSFTLKPSGKIFYGKEIDNFASESYISDIQFIEQIETAKAQANKVKKESEIISKENAQDLAAKQKNFDQLIKEADTHYQRGEFQIALLKYLEAKNLFPDKSYPNDRIAELQDLVKALNITEKQKAELEQKYKNAIARADGFFDLKNYSDARPVYEEALQHKPGDVFANGRIKEIDELIIQKDTEALTRKNFNLALNEGEALLKNKDLAKAKDAFMRASNLIPSESIPPQRISEINDLLAEQIRKASDLKDTREAYQNAIQRADKYFGNKEYSAARQAYSEAILIKSDEKYPVNQLALIGKLLNEQNDQYYKTVLARADNAFNANQFDDAIKSYNEALQIKKGDLYCTNRLKEIDQKKAAIELENIRLKKLQEQYDAIMADAGTDFRNKAYQKSKEKYQMALTLKPDEVLPKDQIAKIDMLLVQLQNELEVNRLYAQYIKSAEDAFSQNKLKEARDVYQKANTLKPSEPIPPIRIAEIDKLLAQLEETARLTAMEEAQRLAREKADRDQYASAIAAADKAFNAKKYPLAITHYTTALNALPDEKYPRDQIDKITALMDQEDLEKSLALQQMQLDSLQKIKDKAFELAVSAAKEHEINKRFPQAIQKYEEAIKINPSQNQSIRKLIRNIEDQMQLLAKQDLEYKRIIKLADKLFADSKLNEALIEYRNAVTVKSDEEYPKKQIVEIQSVLTALETNYNNAIRNGDKSFDASDWQNAKTAYTQALGFKPNEAYPTSQLKIVNKNIADSNIANTSRQAEEKAYNEAMGKAEKAMKDDQLAAARIQFEVAKTLSPDEKRPAERIKEIDLLLEQRNKDRLNESQREIDDKYRQAISVADNSFREKSYRIARLQYKQALLIKPAESYPKNQMALIDKLLNEEQPVETYASNLPEPETAKPAARTVYNPAESSEATEARAQSFKTINNYDEAVKKADGSFGIKDYSVARFFYLKASDMKPNEEYPKNQIELIRKLIDSELSGNDISGYEQAITQADAAFTRKTYNIAKFFYYKAVEIKSWEQYPKDRINEILALTNSLLSEKEEKEYRDVIAKGDEAYFNKDISIARFYYNKAISIKKEDNYPRIKIKDIQKLIEQDEQDQLNLEYRNLIELADQALEIENFSIARFNYNKAITLKPAEKYPKDQLKRIRETLDKPAKEALDKPAR